MRKRIGPPIPCVLLAGLASLIPGAVRGADCRLVWTLVSSPEVADGNATLGALAAVSPDDIWAAGNFVKDGGRHSLIERWDGKAWNVVPAPDGPRKLTWLTGLAAPGAKDVWLVGYSSDAIVGESMSESSIAHWDGDAWSRVPSPNVQTSEVSEDFGGYPVSNELMSVAATASDDVWAVGRSYTIVRGQDLIVHWDGKAWSVTPSPHPGVSGWLRSVVAISRTDAWAFGESYREISLGEEGGTGLMQLNLILHWDGKSWSEVESPNVGFFVNGLYSASAVSADDIWAVGYHYTVFGVQQVQQPTILHWDGSGWTVFPSPVLNRENAYLFSVSALAPNEVFAVGFYDTGPPLPKYDTLIERWDGFTWSILPSQDPVRNHYLYAVAAIAPDDVWAVGEAFYQELPYGVLVEHYTASCLEGIFLRGDANGDLTLDISDAVAALGYLFLGAVAPCRDALDTDDNGSIEITDPIYLLNFIFQGGEEPTPPFPGPGSDPTQDDQDCQNAL